MLACIQQAHENWVEMQDPPSHSSCSSFRAPFAFSPGLLLLLLFLLLLFLLLILLLLLDAEAYRGRRQHLCKLLMGEPQLA